MYTQLISILGISFLLGMRHATDPDHLVAITTVIAKQKKGILNTALIGALWGIGHSITVTLVAIPVIIYSLVIPPSLEQIMELIVGLMLIILGILNLSGISAKMQDKLTPVTIHNHPHRPLIIGLIHGLAGSAAIALLILSTIQDTVLSIVYLLVFHIGIITGMMIITLGIGASIMMLNKQSDIINRYLVLASGLLSLLFGLYIMLQIVTESSLQL